MPDNWLTQQEIIENDQREALRKFYAAPYHRAERQFVKRAFWGLVAVGIVAMCVLYLFGVRP